MMTTINTIAKNSEIRAVEYHAFFIRPKTKAQKETTAHSNTIAN
jgi:hypothetical protein